MLIYRKDESDSIYTFRGGEEDSALLSRTQNEPSPEIKPANQLGSFISRSSNVGFISGTTAGKDAANLSDKPLFIDAFIPRILAKPSLVR